MTAPDPLQLSYSDNYRLTVGARLAAEILADPSHLDVVSGYFAPSVWAAVGEALSRLGEFRLLIGKDHELGRLDRDQETANVEALVRASIRQETEPEGLAARDDAEGVAALIAFLEHQREASRDEVVKLWRGSGFLHAKAYILAGSVGIGSANFTFNGLCRNRELVGWRQDRNVVNEVQQWFDGYWNDADSEPYTDRLIEILRQTPLVSDEYRPYDVLIRTLAARYGTDRPPSLEAAQFDLKWFQEDAVIRLVRLLNGRARGALLADAVGLGKTYMAMGVIHHYLYTQAERRRGGRGRPVLLVIPASLQSTWETVLDEANLSWACQVLTTQRLRADFDARPYAGADLIVIDEAHRLRGGGTWFHKAMDLVTGGERAGEKRVLLLTATPVNTGMNDLVNLLRVMTKGERAVWAPEVADYERYLDRVEKQAADPFPILDRSIVRRSRSDVLEAEAQARVAGLQFEPIKLPDRRTEHIDYGYDAGGADLFEDFARTLRSLALAPYDLQRFRGEAAILPEQLPLRNSAGEEIAQPDLVQFSPGSLAALYASGLLTRFQSSIAAIRKSLYRLDIVLRRCDEALAADPPRLPDLQGSPGIRALLREETSGRDRDDEEQQAVGVSEGLDDELLERAWAEAMEAVPPLADAHEYRLDDVRDAIEQDRTLISRLLERLPSEAEDGKLAALVDALNRDGKAGRKGAPGLAQRRVLIFSQFRDTARYVHRRLSEADVTEAAEEIALIDGAVSSPERARVTAFFDPDRAGEAELAARATDRRLPRILVSTDVLAEGHNLQLADTVVNFDLHFNPQVAVQRAGRIDRLESPHKVVWLVSMLPPEGLDRHIGLLSRLNERFRRIHGLGLGDERVTTLAGDVQGQTLEQIRRLYADDASVLDEIERTWTFGSTDYMRQPLAAFLSRAGMERLNSIPVGVSSVKRLPEDWRHGEGAFLAFAAPASPGEQRETYWRFYPRLHDGTYGDPMMDDVEIFRAIACFEAEPRATLAPAPDGPGVFDWTLVRRAADELASTLTLQRAQAEIQRGASERSRSLRTELRANSEGLEVDGVDALVERLLQVRVEDYDGRSGWRPFDDARRALRRAETEGDRYDAAVELGRRGLELFGAPVEEPGSEPVGEVQAEALQLIAYEALVLADRAATSTEEQAQIAMGGSQALLVPDENRLG
jgi:superfamily II DNA or RNA helicase